MHPELVPLSIEQISNRFGHTSGDQRLIKKELRNEELIIKQIGIMGVK